LANCFFSCVVIFETSFDVAVFAFCSAAVAAWPALLFGLPDVAALTSACFSFYFADGAAVCAAATVANAPAISATRSLFI
jgi:hypothetical protein